jgi:putative aldouronate transport system substrate-binding protein
MKKHIRTISFLIAFVLFFAMAAGCEGVFSPPAETEPPVQVEEIPPPEPEDRDYLEPFSRYDETVIVTVGRFYSTYVEYLAAPGVVFENNIYIDMLYNELNIQVEIIFNVPFEEYHETLERHKAADTLPDTFCIPNTPVGLRFLNELVQNDILADLSDAFSHTLGGKSREYLDGWDIEQLFQYNMIDGRILATPVIGELFNTPLMWIRQDWLDQLELDMPRTIEELEAVALHFLDAEMGGGNAGGIMFMPEDMLDQHYGILPLFAAFGAYPNNWLDVGGSVEWGGIQAETRDALALLRDWNEMGIIPDRMLSMSSDEVFNNFIGAQRSGIFFGTWIQPRASWHEHGAASQNLNENIQWVPFLGPLNARGQYAPSNELIFPGGQVVLASHSNPEAVIKAMNFIDEVRNWHNPEFDNLRVEIQNWRNHELDRVWVEYLASLEELDDVELGEHRAVAAISPFHSLLMPQERLEIALAMRDYSATGVLEVPGFLEHHLESLTGSALFTNEDISPQWWALSDSAREVYLTYEDGFDLHFYVWWAQFVGYWAFNVVGNMFIDGALDGSYVEVMPAFVGETNAWAEYGEQLMELQISTFIRIISGELPLEAFDYFVAEWHELGGEEATREVNELLRNS